MSQPTGSHDMSSPVSDDAYNVITVLQSKLEAIEVYREFSQDGHMDLWRQLAEQDMHTIDMLLDQLEQMVQRGELRSRSSRRAA